MATKTRLDVLCAKNGAYACPIGSGKVVLHPGVHTRHLKSKQAATTLGSGRPIRRWAPNAVLGNCSPSLFTITTTLMRMRRWFR
jgi:hypothetical protein